jgi:hypothetical protein
VKPIYPNSSTSLVLKFAFIPLASPGDDSPAASLKIQAP